MSAIVTPTVPWIASWSAENRYEVRPCRWAGGQQAVWQPHAPGTGDPLFKAKHLVRGRKAIVKKLCGVCGEHLPMDDRWIVPHGEILQVGGRQWFGLAELASHKSCLEYARASCPALKKAYATGILAGKAPVQLRFVPPVCATIASPKEMLTGFGVSTTRSTLTGLVELISLEMCRSLFPQGVAQAGREAQA